MTVNTYYALTFFSTKPHGELKTAYNAGHPKINVPNILREARWGGGGKTFLREGPKEERFETQVGV